ncbi:hypothetical protein GCM10010448_59020 [Streptomyces glomeratus]|uniref:Uncharacterized protein n=1 Tax=Streptomyces glomeratus TaxID=284452 RepID=A0ABP6LZC7_9ACTN
MDKVTISEEDRRLPGLWAARPRSLAGAAHAAVREVGDPVATAAARAACHAAATPYFYPLATLTSPSPLCDQRFYQARARELAARDDAAAGDRGDPMGHRARPAGSAHPCAADAGSQPWPQSDGHALPPVRCCPPGLIGEARGPWLPGSRAAGQPGRQSGAMLDLAAAAGFLLAACA